MFQDSVWLWYYSQYKKLKCKEEKQDTCQEGQKDVETRVLSKKMISIMKKNTSSNENTFF